MDVKFLNDTEQKLEQVLLNSLASILNENQERINRFTDIKTVASWYKDARQDPKKNTINHKLIE